MGRRGRRRSFEGPSAACESRNGRGLGALTCEIVDREAIDWNRFECATKAESHNGIVLAKNPAGARTQAFDYPIRQSSVPSSATPASTRNRVSFTDLCCIRIFRPCGARISHSAIRTAMGIVTNFKMEAAPEDRSDPHQNVLTLEGRTPGGRTSRNNIIMARFLIDGKGASPRPRISLRCLQHQSERDIIGDDPVDSPARGGRPLFFRVQRVCHDGEPVNVLQIADNCGRASRQG